MRSRVLAAVSFLLGAAVALLLLPSPVRAAPGPTFKGDPQAVAEVQAAYQKFTAAGSWRSRMTGGGGNTLVEYVAPDRFHMVITQNNQTTEMFMIGRDVWMKSGGTCSKMPANVPVRNPKDMAAHASAGSTITVVRGGPATIEGTATQSYMVTTESSGTTTTEKLYVATGTGLIRRLEIQGKDPLTIDYFDYNVPLKVDPPC